MPPMLSSGESDHRFSVESERSNTSDDLYLTDVHSNGEVDEFSCLVKAIKDSMVPQRQPVPTARCGAIFPAGTSSSHMLAHLMATRIRNGV